MVFWVCAVGSGHATSIRGGMFSIQLSESEQENHSLKSL